VTLNGTLARKKPEAHLVLPYQFDRGPRYVLMGGLLFQELSQPYLDAFGEEQRSGAILRLARIATNPEKYEEAGSVESSNGFCLVFALKDNLNFVFKESQI
jgi:hypothetical protein